MLKSSTQIQAMLLNISTNSTLCVNLRNNYTFCVKWAQILMQYLSILRIFTHVCVNSKCIYAKCVNLNAFNTFCVNVRET